MLGEFKYRDVRVAGGTRVTPLGRPAPEWTPPLFSLFRLVLRQP